MRYLRKMKQFPKRVYLAPQYISTSRHTTTPQKATHQSANDEKSNNQVIIHEDTVVKEFLMEYEDQQQEEGNINFASISSNKIDTADTGIWNLCLLSLPPYYPAHDYGATSGIIW